MPITDLTDDELEALIGNYRRLGVTEGGIYSLSEALLEQRRRIKTLVPVPQVFDAILELSGQSPDGLITYIDLWKALFPGVAWKGNASVTQIAKVLAQVIGYCVDKGAPIVTTLVVRKQTRKLDQSAIENIYSESKDFGLDVGAHGANEFCKRHEVASKELAATFKNNRGTA